MIGELAVEVYEGAPFATAAWRASSCATVALVLAGAALDGETVLLSGSVFHRPAAIDERLTFGANGCTLVLVAADAYSLEQFGLVSRCRATIDDFAMIGERICREMRRGDAASPLALRSAALHLIGRAIHLFQAEAPPSWLAGARDVIAARFRERIRPGDVAAAVGVAPATLARAFRRQFGTTVSDALRAARIEAAVRALRCSNASTSAVAASCGFYDASHLIRTLAAAHSLAPAELREAERA
jgi:AraC-like DNA-binding protein